ncbi:hypothetical protein DFH27DRAFT_634281 [Peziza echinospora]|nr:hypothetical protein DFH27DRAFT_634281 [Peziza echinospora]
MASRATPLPSHTLYFLAEHLYDLHHGHPTPSSYRELSFLHKVMEIVATERDDAPVRKTRSQEAMLKLPLKDLKKEFLRQYEIHSNIVNKARHEDTPPRALDLNRRSSPPTAVQPQTDSRAVSSYQITRPRAHSAEISRFLMRPLVRATDDDFKRLLEHHCSPQRTSHNYSTSRSAENASFDKLLEISKSRNSTDNSTADPDLEAIGYTFRRALPWFKSLSYPADPEKSSIANILSIVAPRLPPIANRTQPQHPPPEEITSPVPSPIHSQQQSLRHHSTTNSRSSSGPPSPDQDKGKMSAPSLSQPPAGPHPGPQHGPAPTNVLGSMTAADLAALIKDQLAQALTPLQMEINALKAAREQSSPPPDRATLRMRQLEALKQQIQREEDLIAQGQWQETAERQTRESTSASVIDTEHHNVKLRFDTKTLPKYIHYVTDLNQWIREIQLEVDLFGEKIVCPSVSRYCFSGGDNNVVHSWFHSLDPSLVSFITSGEGCWDRMKQVMRAQWGLSAGLAVKQAVARKKLAHETYLSFYFAKLALLQSAYPNSPDEAYIEMIKSSLDDPKVAEWAKECKSLSVFSNQLRDYDDHLKRFADHFEKKSPEPRQSNTRSSLYYQTSATIVPTQVMSNSDKKSEQIPQTFVPSKPRGRGEKRAERSIEDIVKQNKTRAASIKPRPDPSGKMVSSFVRTDGTVAFLKEPCKICAQAGFPNQMHFSFACQRNKLSGSTPGEAYLMSMEEDANLNSAYLTDSDTEKEENDDGSL